MAEWLFAFTDILYYFISNLMCLVASLELILSKTILLFSYIDLLVDISESFSIMIVIMVLISSAVTTLIHIHDLTQENTQNKSVYSSSYSSYLKFLQFKNRL